MTAPRSEIAVGAWEHIVRFFVQGEPKAQPRHQTTALMDRHGKPIVDSTGRPVLRQYTPDSADAWKQAVQVDGHPHRPEHAIATPVGLKIAFFMPRPKRLMRKSDPDYPLEHPVRPDLDNLEKAVMDAMTDAGWWTDDCLVVAKQSSKQYHAKTGKPGAMIELTWRDNHAVEVGEADPSRAGGPALGTTTTAHLAPPARGLEPNDL
jgi:Holliday junction resolvase RusA-like endonuclease